MYLNFDMLASPNPGYFTYDGDQSAPPTDSVPRVPEGSAGIERMLAAYLKVRERPRRTPISTAVPTTTPSPRRAFRAGGLFAGAEEKKTAEQAKLWGGDANQPFDPNYHKSTDTFEHSTVRRSRSRAAVSLTPSGSTRRTRAGATASPSATTAPATRCRLHEGGGTAARCRPVAGRVLVGSAAPAQRPTRRVSWRPRSRSTASTRTFRSSPTSPLSGKGGRADGTPGYDASVDYVAGALRDKGFDVETPEVAAARDDGRRASRR